MSLPLPSKRLPEEVLYVYLAVSEKAVTLSWSEKKTKSRLRSTTVARHSKGKIYPLEKLTLALVRDGPRGVHDGS